MDHRAIVVVDVCDDGCSRCWVIVVATSMVVGTIVSGMVDTTCHVAIDANVCCCGWWWLKLVDGRRRYSSDRSCNG